MDSPINKDKMLNEMIESLFGGYLTGDTSKGFGVKVDIRLKPYDYFRNYVKQIYDKGLLSKGQVSEGFVNVLTRALDNSEVIEVDKRLVPMIEQTENELFYRPLFFETIFVNAEFHVGDYFIKGIILLDGMEYAAHIEDWFIITCAVHKDGQGIFLFTQLLKEPLAEEDFKNDIIAKQAMEIHTQLRHMACTFVDLVMMNDEDLDIITIKPTKKQQEKRERYKRPRIPTRVYIRPKTHFIKYIEEYLTEEAKPFSHRFRVRGYIRHYRNDRYTEKRKSKPQFIKPFYKGQGILIQKKRYKVMQ
ncbi:MAG: hypothetical protein PHW62_00325 [Candidatus Ratteibacteria bacterium]|nr:hypothetical protein [Candidatus Ratteibacteria bacterium]